MILYYGFPHRSVKWWKRVFFHIVDTAIVNAHILYNACAEVKLTQLEFRRAVAEGLLDGYDTAKARRRAQDPQLPLRLKERPFPEPIPNGGRSDCRVCSDRAGGNRHQTKYQCKVCKTPLCIYPCFEKYHTFINYNPVQLSPHVQNMTCSKRSTLSSCIQYKVI